jgi:hypothetical protein
MCASHVLGVCVAEPRAAAHPVTAEFSTQSPHKMLLALAVAVEAAEGGNGSAA